MLRKVSGLWLFSSVFCAWLYGLRSCKHVRDIESGFEQGKRGGEWHARCGFLDEIRGFVRYAGLLAIR